MSSKRPAGLPKPADRVVRRPRTDQISPVHIRLAPRRVRSVPRTPPLVLVYAFAVLVFLGTLFLVLPFSHVGEGFAPLVDALFTATSAATVTGLVTQETSSYWTIYGQLVILVLMFAGGLGVMTIVGSMFVIAGQRVPLTQRLVMRETIGTASFTDITRVIMRIVLWAVAIQAIGFVVLFARFAFVYSPGDAVWHALFQAVSGFNAAGFVSVPDSENLSAFRTDKWVVGTIAVLVVLGSLSYMVISDVLRRRRFSTLALNTKLVVVFTVGLLLAGGVVFFALESGPESTIGELSLLDRVVTSAFHSVSRTSGFSTIDFDQTTDQTNVFYAALMFIGGASASVAGGIKVTTFALIVISTLATLRGRTNISAFNRTIPRVQVQWAYVIAIVSLFGVALVALTLTFTESEYPFVDLLFEAVSAFGTVGLSTGLTGDLSTPSQLLLVVAMFVGRVAPPMVIVVALSRQDEEDRVRYAKEGVTIA